MNFKHSKTFIPILLAAPALLACNQRFEGAAAEKKATDIVAYRKAEDFAYPSDCVSALFQMDTSSPYEDADGNVVSDQNSLSFDFRYQKDVFFYEGTTSTHRSASAKGGNLISTSEKWIAKDGDSCYLITPSDVIEGEYQRDSLVEGTFQSEMEEEAASFEQACDYSYRLIEAGVACLNKARQGESAPENLAAYPIPPAGEEKETSTKELPSQLSFLEGAKVNDASYATSGKKGNLSAELSLSLAQEEGSFPASLSISFEDYLPQKIEVSGSDSTGKSLNAFANIDWGSVVNNVPKFRD